MKYRFRVIIEDPNTPEGMNSQLSFDLEATFGYDPNQYGNGHSVKIQTSKGFECVYDIRYDKTFHKDRKEEWLEQWANSYWSGENGAYRVVEFKMM